jgi:hypothetical protein
LRAVQVRRARERARRRLRIYPDLPDLPDLPEPRIFRIPARQTLSSAWRAGVALAWPPSDHNRNLP